jgi:hypothetical protein
MNEQRERFEAWAAGRFELHWHVDAERYASAITQAAWESWQAACPEGWQAVPEEPSEEMLARAHQEIDWVRPNQGTHKNDDPSQTITGGSSCKEDMQRAYRKLLSAAPRPEDV